MFSNKTNPNWSVDNDWTGTAPGFSTAGDATLNHNGIINQDFTVNNNVIINANKVLIINGDVVVAAGTFQVDGEVLIAGGSLTIENTANLVVSGHIISSGSGTLTINAGASVTINGAAGISWAGQWVSSENTATIVVNGSISVGDGMVNSQLITGFGNFDVEGVLENTGTILGCSLSGAGCCGLGRAAFGSTCLVPPSSVKDFTSIADGPWDDGATWDQSGDIPSDQDNILIDNFTVDLSKGKGPKIFNLEITNDGVLNQDNIDLEIVGNYKNDSIHNVIKKGLVFSGVNAVFSGVGGEINLEGQNTNQSRIYIENNMSVQSGAELLILGTGETAGIVIDGVLTNNGSMQMAADVSGTGSWVNANGSDLYVYETIFGLALTASASNNVVHFSDVADQTVVVPVGSEYNRLIIGGGGTKTLAGNLTISEFLVINSTLDVSASNYQLTVGGNWTNNGDFLKGSGKVILNGSSASEIVAGDGTEEFYQLEVDKTSSEVDLYANVIVENELTFTNGDVVCLEATQIELGTGTGNTGTLNHNNSSSLINGPFERWISDASGGILFPVGNEEGVHDITFTSSAITAGSLIVEFKSDDPSNDGATWSENAETYYNTFSDGFFDLTADNSFASTSYDVAINTTNFNGYAIDGGVNESVVSRVSSGNNWAFDGASGTNAASVINRTGLLNGIQELTLVDNEICVKPSAPQNFTGATSVCTGTSIEYEVDPITSATFTWVITGGTQTAGANTETITVLWDDIGGSGSIKVYASVACGGSTNDGPVTEQAIAIGPIVTSSISGRNILVENSTGEVYTVDDNSYTYNWTVNGGTFAPSTTNSITVAWGAAGSGKISVIADDPGCTDDAAEEALDVTLFSTYTSVQTGDYDDGTTWEGGEAPTVGGENVKVSAGHIVTMTAANRTINNLVIDAGATLATGAYQLTIENLINVDGTLDASTDITGNNIVMHAAGVDAIITGDGSVNAYQVEITNGAWILEPGANLIMDLTNYAINNSTLSIEGKLQLSGSNTKLTSNGFLYASAVGSGIKYTGSGTPRVLIPSDGYHDLEFDNGSGTYSLTAPIVVDGDLTLTSGTFTANSQKVTFSGDALQTVSGTFTLYDAEFYNASGVAPSFTMSSPIEVNNILTLTEGIIDCGGNIFTASGSILGGNSLSFIDGQLDFNIPDGTSEYVFPVGSGQIYAPIGIDLAAGRTGMFSIQYFPTGYGNYTLEGAAEIKEVSENEYWTIDDDGDAINGGGGNAADYIRLYSNNVSVSELAVLSDVRVARFGGTYWSTEDFNNSGASSYGSTTNGTYIQITNVEDVDTPADPFTFGGINEDALPVDYRSFVVQEDNSQVSLVWVTASEIDNDYFDIEHSMDGISFQKVGQRNGHGDSNEPLSYYFLHATPALGMNYYRLKQVDFDGQFEYSDIKSVQVGSAQDFEINLYPNPTTGLTRLDLSLQQAQLPVQVVLMNLNGEITFEYELSPGMANFEFDTSSYLNGIYLVRVIQGNSISIGKLIISK
ncbi:MAG: T9SS type A sorting domain-containing protein [Reichenbachiella sp.]